MEDFSHKAAEIWRLWRNQLQEWLEVGCSLVKVIAVTESAPHFCHVFLSEIQARHCQHPSWISASMPNWLNAIQYSATSSKVHNWKRLWKLELILISGGKSFAIHGHNSAAPPRAWGCFYTVLARGIVGYCNQVWQTENSYLTIMEVMYVALTGWHAALVSVQWIGVSRSTENSQKPYIWR